MNRLSCRTLVVALALPLLGIGLGSGCSKQSQGEPCDADGIDQQDGRSDDCETGLVCTDSKLLFNGNGSFSAQDRCCPPTGSTITDERCTPGGGTGTGGAGGTGSVDSGEDAEGDGASGTAGESGSGGTGGTNDSGGEACAVPCNFNSDCTEPLVCGPQGCCQPECRETRDCTSPEQCVNGTCEIVVPDAATD